MSMYDDNANGAVEQKWWKRIFATAQEGKHSVMKTSYGKGQTLF